MRSVAGVLVLVMVTMTLGVLVTVPRAAATVSPPAMVTPQTTATGDLGWTPPTTLEAQSPSNANLGSVAIAGDRSGVIAYEHDGQRATIMATRTVPGGGDGGTDWVTPVALSSGGCNNYAPSAAMDTAGDAIVVWYDTCNFAIHATRFVPGAGWTSPVAIDQPYWYSVSPQIAMNSAGAAFVTWEAWDGSRYHVFANRFAPGTGWGAAVSLDPTNTNTTGGANVGVDAAGNAIVTWYRLDGGTYHIYAVRYNAGTAAWSTSQLLNWPTTWAVYPTISVDSLGNAVVAWLEWDGAYSIWVNRYDATSGTWTGNLTIESQTSWAFFQAPRVSANNGSAVVAWTMYGPGTDTYSVWANRYTAGVGWGTEADVDGVSGTTYVANYPSVALDRFGNASIAYQIIQVTATTPYPAQIYGVRYSALTGATSNYQPMDFQRTGVGVPLLAMDASGDALAAWTYNDNTPASPRNGILSNRYTFGTGWRSYGAQQAEWDENVAPGWLQLESNAAGDAIFSWTQNDGPIWRGYAALYSPSTGWGPATRIENLNIASIQEEWSAIDPSGNAIVLFRIYDGVKYGVDAVYYSTSTGWGTPQRISSDALSPTDVYDNYWLRIAMDSHGNGLAVWEGWNGTSENVYADWFDAGTQTWGGATPIPSPVSVSSAAVGLDANGDAVVVWQAWDGSAYSVYASEYTATSGWSQGALIEHNNSMWATAPYGVAINANGDAAVSWSFWNGARYFASVNTYTPGTGWGTEHIFTVGAGDGWPAIPSVDASGDVLLGYQLWNGNSWDVYAATAPAGGSWGAPMKLNSGTGDATQIVTALDAHGNGYAAWTQYNGFGYDIVTRRFLDGGFLPSVVVNQPSPASPSTDTGTPLLAVDGHGNAILGWNQWQEGILVPYAAEYIVGTGAPGLTLSSPSAGLLTKNPSVTVSGSTDPGATVTIDGSAVSVGLDGSFSDTYTLADGTHTFTVVATNAAGLTQTDTRKVTVDTTPPAVALSSPLTGTLTNNAVATVTGTTEPGATVDVNGVNAVVSATGTFDVSIPLQEGANTITATATDAAGNAASSSVQVTLDTRAPALTLSSPTPGLTKNAAVLVSGSTEPGATVTVDGNAVTVDGSGAFSTTLSLSDGTHTVTVDATDAAGNRAQSVVSVTVDTTPPAISITTPSSGTNLTTPIVTVTGTTDPGATVVVNGYTVTADAAGHFTVQLPLVAGANTITATATDAAGNSQSAQVSVTYTNTLPTTESNLSSLSTMNLVLIILVVVSLALGAFEMIQIRKLKAAQGPAPSAGKPEAPKPPEDDL